VKRTWIRVLAVALVWAALLTSSTVALAEPMPASDQGSAQRWIVALEPGANPRRVAALLAARHGGQVDHVYEHALRGFSFRGSPAAAKALARNPQVAGVTPDRELRLIAETLPWGLKRIDALHQTEPDAHEAGFTGAGVAIGILDTGIDLDHPDLPLDVARGRNCMGAGPPEDGHGHGTHVAGTAAAVRNGDGVVGVAPDAVVVPIKVLDDSGVGSDATVICGVDYLTQLATDGDPANDIPIANMSLGEQAAPGHCADGGLRQAICQSVAAGVTYVVAAGNSSIDAAGFVPAAYPEVITVSAMVDLDGEPGGEGGCYLLVYCDDDFAFFSNFGSVIDVIAPGVRVHSTWIGGYNTSDGTSMAAPHVAGVAALAKAANPALNPADIELLLKATGECPDGLSVDDGATASDCQGQGRWDGDPDGYAEPLPNAFRAATAATTWDPLPTITVTSPSEGATVEGLVSIAATASDDVAVTHVEFRANGGLIADDTDLADGWSAAWDASGVDAGRYSLQATAFDNAGQTSTHTITVSVGTNVAGDWVGNYGADGYLLAAWDGTSDLVSLPNATAVLELGGRYQWSTSTTDVRALEGPDQSTRRAATYYHSTQVRVRLDFSAAYSGTLHLYAVDWDNKDRRQTLAVSDGTGTRRGSLTVGYGDGAWMHFPISVGDGDSVTVSVTRDAGPNAVLSGILLGGPGEAPPPPPLPPYETGVQGDWVGNYGVDGYLLAAWDGTADLLSWPTGTTLVEQGSRHRWSSSTTDLRALESPDESQRRAATYYHSTQVRVRLDFSAAYSGTLHLYAVDWDNKDRRQTLAVTDATGTQSVSITTNFRDGAWVHLPVSVEASNSVTITVTNDSAVNAVLSGIFVDPQFSLVGR